MNPRTRGRRPQSARSNDLGAPPLDRRRFLILAGGTAAWLALRPAEALARKAAFPSILQPWSLADELPGNPVDVARALIGAAVLAPSEWNSQPWRFEVEGNSIRIVAEPRRALPASDPDRRGMMIGLGAALENLLVAARAWGLRTTVSYLPRGGASPVVAEVTWAGNGESRRDRALFAAIPARRTNRREYDRRGIYPQNRTQLMAESMDGLQIHWLDDPARIATVADIAHQATREQVEDARIQSEQFAWMRFDDDAEKRGDGVPIGALELGGPARWFAGRYFRPGSWFLRFGADHAAGQARDQVKSAGALALLTASRRDDSQWLMCGQSLERLALRATHLGIAQQILSAPTESERYRGDLRREFRTAAQEEPVLLVRLGHAKATDATPRRSVSMVATFRNT